jgi:hypothetical protein
MAPSGGAISVAFQVDNTGREIAGMMTRRNALGTLACLAMSLLSGCGSPKSEYRQRIIVEVETPSGLRTGSSVIQVRHKQKPKALEHIPGNGFYARGEAVAVEVAPGRILFALLSPPRSWDVSSYQARLITKALMGGAESKPALALPGNGYGVDAHKVIGESNVEVTLPKRLYPMLVTFQDINDPLSVKLVDPADLAPIFGPEFQLKRITVKVTDDPVTIGVTELRSYAELR